MKAFYKVFFLKKVSMYGWVIFLISTGLLFVNCKINTAKPSGKLAAIRVLMVGGGSSHDFNKWYKQADGETLRKGGLATVTYLSNPDSILLYLPQTDVLFLTNNQPINDPKVREAIFSFTQAGKGLVLAHPALWYNWKDWPEYNLQLVSGGSRGHPFTRIIPETN